ncbi:MAG: 16S rRNA (cytosine(1402)-N(4))-methyltransferase RsmH [Culturomica sp.]|jgi:16S rRNA (cytosine1402-N4)-methyltransferase|nr:16S rRNA (cytosine(1402)-N(4))-methyltransferase RsmH [Culturomica sp.]
MEYHVPVLLNEVVDGLNINPDGVYLDLTFGGGGHSRAILKHLKGGRLIGFDQDEDALRNVPDDEHFIFVNHNFKYLRNFLRYYGFDKVDGILADLGVSSHEFDEADRGFSFRFDSELDMRMNRRSKLNAADVLNTYSEADLVRIFRDYGELENAGRTAAMIVKARESQKIVTSTDLNDAIAVVIPKIKVNKYLARLYQALRIEVNGELDALQEMLERGRDVLKSGGRMVVITYHSLEDRIVKNFFKSGNFEGKVEKDPIFGDVRRDFLEINRKVITPSEEEINVNPRSRSAKLRIAEKI